MGVSRSRDDYRLGKPVIQDIPSSCVLSSCFLRGAIFLFLDRDTRSEKVRRHRDIYTHRDTGAYWRGNKASKSLYVTHTVVLLFLWYIFPSEGGKQSRAEFIFSII